MNYYEAFLVRCAFVCTLDGLDLEDTEAPNRLSDVSVESFILIQTFHLIHMQTRLVKEIRGRSGRSSFILQGFPM